MIRRMFRALEASPGVEVLTGLDPEGGSERFRCSAGQMLDAVGCWQRLLKARAVEPGDRVGVDLPRGAELLAAHLAVLASGACVVPVNPALASNERSRLLARARLATLLTSEDRPPASGSPMLTDHDPESPALLIFTSGTTGDPKGVPLTLENLEANLAALAQVWALRAGDRLLHVLPAHHVHGLVLGLYGSLRVGMSIAMLPRFNADRCVEAAAEEGVTVFMGVPTMFHRMARSPSARELPGMRLFISGSAPLVPRDFHEFEKRFGCAPLERYGLSETLIVTSNPLEGPRRPGSVGLPLPSTEVRLADDGEIEVRGPAVMRGYWNDPAATADALRDGYFRTGDLGRRDDAGFLYISGRKKELIIVGGSNVLPGEVERALAEVAGVDELVAVGLPDPDRGEVVAVFVVPGGAQDEDRLERQLRAVAEETLASYKRPRAYRFLSELPRNAMGKVDRLSLRRG